MRNRIADALITEGAQKIDELQVELLSLQTVMADIVDCYGLGQTPEKFCEQAHGFIMEGRELVKNFKRD